MIQVGTKSKIRVNWKLDNFYFSKDDEKSIQAKFAKKCSVCRQVILADAHHGTLCAPQKTLQELMELTLDHFV